MVNVAQVIQILKMALTQLTVAEAEVIAQKALKLDSAARVRAALSQF